MFTSSRRQALLAGALTSLAPSDLMAKGIGRSRPAGADGFDFLHGAWQVRHRKLKAPFAGGSGWVEFDGRLYVDPILGGFGNIDRQMILDPAGKYLATSIRVFDARSGDWSIRGADGRHAGLGKPAVGRFEGRTGRFLGDADVAGRPVRVRCTYEDLGPGRARWSRSLSTDGGTSWDTHWTMNLSRGTGR